MKREEREDSEREIKRSWLSFTIEAVNLGNLSALVVPTQERDTVRPLGFQHQKVGEGLQAVVPSVDKVPLTKRFKLLILPDIYKSNGLHRR